MPAMSEVYIPRSKTPRTHTPKPAPGRLEILRSWLNTAPRKGQRDLLTGAPDLERWLARHELLPVGIRVTVDEHLRGVEIRDALHALASGDPKGPSRVDQVFRGLTYEVVFDGREGPRFVPKMAGVELAFGRLLGLFLDAEREGSWSRLRPCAACGRVFHDASNRGHRKWCTDRCGERVRTANARRRARYGPKR